LSKGLVETITEVFKAQAPHWACEFTGTYVTVANVNSGRTKVVNKFAAELTGGASAENAMPVVRQLLSLAGFKGSEIAVVVPDEMVRVAFVTAENPSKDPEEQRTFIRWKLKKSVPFDVDTAQVAYRIVGPHRAGTGVDILVALAPRSVVQEYETSLETLDIHAGIVLPSTLAALNLFQPPAGDTLFVKVAPDCIATAVFQNRRVQFYRRVTDVSLYDAVYPTVLYYQDKLGGTTLDRMYVCGHNDMRLALAEVQEKLGLMPQRIEPQSVEDIFKPALGAIHLKPESVI